jgi:hypothetical protein
MFYILRFNFALSRLGIAPGSLPYEYRMIGQTLGKENGCNPKEAALIILGQLPILYHMEARAYVAKSWVTQGKIDIENPAIRTALFNLSWDYLLHA